MQRRNFLKTGSLAGLTYQPLSQHHAHNHLQIKKQLKTKALPTILN
jgi:hypothetical protein